MEYFGVDFVAINASLKHHLDALSAAIVVVLFIYLVPIGCILTVYLLCCTKYWTIVLAYLFWIWVIDNRYYNTSESGGRFSEWVCSWSLFKYAANYYPINVTIDPTFKIDPKLNYIAASFPHGIMPMGTMIALQTNALRESMKPLNKHTYIGLTLKCNFYIPIYRELLLAIRMCSVSERSINYILNHPGGGKIAGIVVGGAKESFYTQTGDYRVVLKNRKGFIKLALRNATPIIPVFAFGQNSSLKHVSFVEGTIVRRVQNWIKELTGVALLPFYGRGFFQERFGMVPLQKAINIVVGAPINVQKIDQPTAEDIDTLHQTFVKKLSELFENYKYEFEQDPDKTKLIIC